MGSGKRHGRLLLLVLTLSLVGVLAFLGTFPLARFLTGSGKQVEINRRPPAPGKTPTERLPQRSPTSTVLPTPVVSPTPSPTPRLPLGTGSPPSPRVAQDSFQRPNQAGWGMASDGQVWQIETGGSTSFSIEDGVGRIRGVGPLTTLLGPSVGNSDVTAREALSAFDGGATNLGLVVRFQDALNWVKLYLDGQTLTMLESKHGLLSIVCALPFLAFDETTYVLRIRVQGEVLFAKAWDAHGDEPPFWLLSMTLDGMPTTGRVGIRVVLEEETDASLFSFRALPF